MGLTMDPFSLHHRKDKVVVIIGAIGTGESKLAINLAARFPPAEIVNSNKMQVYKGLNITTNKVTEEECCGVPHHLLGIADTNSNFTANDFTHHASSAIDSIVQRDCLPIVAGGSKSYIEALVQDDAAFRLKFECCFLWVDVDPLVLDLFLSKWVNRMIKSGQIDEVCPFFDPARDYNRGIRKTIRAHEFDQYFRTESIVDERSKKFLEAAIAKIKSNNCTLAHRQLQKIHHLHSMWKQNITRLDATKAFKKSAEKAEETWENQVVAKSHRIVHKFLYEESVVVSAAIVMMAVSPKQVVVATGPSMEEFSDLVTLTK
ncbi:adenylate isopentenyltransferase 5, chloroplastic-like [Senna tora]|uniref:Adenylate isopentenyltransferase 5, chloroplastic-like n=1 Tax=Senna tora TaxID=362788 RepID=A0A834WFR5_9FABA|nr:adenylate isopentenyltransferase 5, chloroplastic-like [Senna tora]